MRSVGARAAGARLDGVLVTPMLQAGIDAILGAVRDPVFGPVLMFGLGGTWVEVFKDVVFRAAPIDAQEALQMIRQTGVGPLIEGVRGQGAIDADALARRIAAFSEFVAAHAGELDSIEVIPWRLLPGRALALDAIVVRHG
jgi:hypothetical protein